MARSPLAILFLCFRLLAQTTPVEITAEPGHHLAFQNPYIRVFQVELAPHASTLLHIHRHDYVYVVLGAAEIENDEQGKPSVKMKLADGEANLPKGGFAHVLRNLADTPFRNVTIEVLRHPTGTRSHQSQRGVSTDSGYVIDTMFDTATVRVSDTKLNPGAILPRHRHRWPHLVVAVTDLDLRNQVKGKPAVEIHRKRGEVNWVKAGVIHALTNIGPEPARFISVEFK
jgi:quercetin dioxygenase-like cupin family protein